MTKLYSNNKKRGIGLALAASLMIAAAAQPAFATTSISSVSIKLDMDLEVGDSLPDLSVGYTDDEDAEVKISENKRYDIVSAKWSKDVEEIGLGDTYKLTVRLEPEDGYAFKSSYSSSKVTVKGGTFVGAKRNSDDTLSVTLKTDHVKGDLEAPDDPRWLSENYKNSKFGYAKWDSVDDAAYDVYLYRNDKIVERIVGWKSTSFNFYPYMTKSGDYHFKVRSVPRTDEIAKYAKSSEGVVSDEMYVASNEVSDGSGKETANNNTSSSTAAAPTDTTQVGWIKSGNKWFFRYPDGSYIRDSWGKINGIWYLFDGTGEMLTGWQLRNGAYYYMNPDGAMLTGWIKDNGYWYYLNPDGSMRVGWLTEGTNTYYLDPTGAMAVGWKEIGGQFYYFHPDGHKAVNEVIDLFYVDHNGVWQKP